MRCCGTQPVWRSISPHSVARAIVKKAAEEGLHHREEHARVEYVVAHGISTILRECRAQIGSAHFIFEDEKIPCTAEIKRAEEEVMQGLSVIYLAVGGRVVGMIGIEDPVRPDAAGVVEALRERGFRHIIMMTGDSAAAGPPAARELHIEEYRAQVLPEDKADMVKRAERRRKLCGHGGETGLMIHRRWPPQTCPWPCGILQTWQREVADITLLSENLTDLLVLRDLSRKLMRRIHGNYGFILSFNTLLMALGISRNGKPVGHVAAAQPFYHGHQRRQHAPVFEK